MAEILMMIMVFLKVLRKMTLNFSLAVALGVLVWLWISREMDKRTRAKCKKACNRENLYYIKRG